MVRGMWARNIDRLRVLYVMLTRRVHIERAGTGATSAVRVLYVANAFLPTLQLSFVRPLQALVEKGEVATELLSQQQIKQMWGGRVQGKWARRWVRKRFAAFDPTVVVFCRYSGVHGDEILRLARERGIPAIYHIDDDLLHVPRHIGEEKFRYHNDPQRLAAVRYLLDNVDLVYCSTAALLLRLQGYGLAPDGVAGAAHCTGEVLSPPPKGDPPVLGYMGIDHAHDFEVALPALVEVMHECPDLKFEIFGPIPVPDTLRQFGVRVRSIPPVAVYADFMKVFAGLGWAVGICPLADTPFNALKGNNKWVEYTSVGAAVVATAGLVYDDCCASGCGVLVSGREEWKAAIMQLVLDPALRHEQVARAQLKLQNEFSLDALRAQVLNIFRLAQLKAALPAVTGGTVETGDGGQS